MSNAERFATVEINNSFYHLPSRKTFREWRAGTPARFTFAVKAGLAEKRPVRNFRG